MKVSCHVIRDILPLYTEHMLSDDSCAMVEEHIKECRECKDYLNGMRTFNVVPLDNNTSPLKKIRSALRRKRVQTAILSMTVAIILTVLVVAFLTAPEYIPYSAGSVKIDELGNGPVLVQFDENVYGHSISSYMTDDGTGYVYHITAWNSMWNRKIRKSSSKTTILLNPDGENVVSVYYCQADGTEDILIYGRDMNPGDGIVTLPRLILSYYALIAAALAVVCGLAMLLVHRSKKALEFVSSIFFLPVSYLLSHLAIKGFTASSYAAERDFYAILLVTIPLYFAILLVRNIFRQHNAKEKDAKSLDMPYNRKI